MKVYVTGYWKDEQPKKEVAFTESIDTVNEAEALGDAYYKKGLRNISVTNSAGEELYAGAPREVIEMRELFENMKQLNALIKIITERGGDILEIYK